LVLEAYCKSIGKEYPQFAFRINREEVYADAGDHDFVTLESFGEEIGEKIG
ncbi:MAG: Fe-S oxidoreductase, partial [Candidatus Copromonas sp.]|nr:Fe-S oxidoreductase [Candidatus Copromonas sp.]